MSDFNGNVDRFEDGVASRDRRAERLRDTAKAIREQFFRELLAPIPEPAATREAEQALFDVLQFAAGQSNEAIQHRLKVTYQERLKSLWHRIGPGFPASFADEAGVIDWSDRVSHALERDHRGAENGLEGSGIPVYAIQPKGDWIGQLNFGTVVRYLSCPLRFPYTRQLYAVCIPPELATSKWAPGTYIILDARPSATWQPMSGGEPAAISTLAIGYGDEIVSWFGHLDQILPDILFARQSEEASAHFQIDREYVVVHQILGTVENG